MGILVHTSVTGSYISTGGAGASAVTVDISTACGNAISTDACQITYSAPCAMAPTTLTAGSTGASVGDVVVNLVTALTTSATVATDRCQISYSGPLSGGFYLSMDYEGDMNKDLGFVSVTQGSRAVTIAKGVARTALLVVGTAGTSTTTQLNLPQQRI